VASSGAGRCEDPIEVDANTHRGLLDKRSPRSNHEQRPHWARHAKAAFMCAGRADRIQLARWGLRRPPSPQHATMALLWTAASIRRGHREADQDTAGEALDAVSSACWRVATACRAAPEIVRPVARKSERRL
jgi:hypothetical protein